MTDILAQPLKPDPRDKRLRSPDRNIRMREKLRRMPEGTFTFAAHLQGIERKKVQEELVDAYLDRVPQPRELAMATEGDEGIFLARFTRAQER